MDPQQEHQTIRARIDDLLESFGGPIPTIKPDVLQRLHKQKDYPAMLGWIKNSMRLELRVGLRIVDKIAGDHPMCIEIAKPIPIIGTHEFKNTRVTVNVTKETIDTKPFEWVVAGFAHELSHVVLFSIGHKLQEDEKAVDLTAMILGFENFDVTAQLAEPDKISVGGYLTLSERKFAANYLRQVRRVRETGSAEFDYSKRSERRHMRQSKCGHCGQINRVPSGPVGGKPVCGNCGKRLPQSSGEIFLRYAQLGEKIDPKMLIIVAFAISIIGFLMLDGSTLPRSPSVIQIIGGRLIFGDIGYRYVLIGSVLLLGLGIYRLYSTDKIQP